MKLKDILLATQTFMLALNNVASADVATKHEDASVTWGFCDQLLTDRSENFLSYEEFYDPEHLKEYLDVYKCINNAPEESVFFDNLALRDRDTKRWFNKYMSQFSKDDINLIVLGGSSGYERSGEKYKQLVMTIKTLIEAVFKQGIKTNVMTGAGPDAMEAASVGQHFSGYSVDETEEALHALAQVPQYVEHDWIRTGREVREKYPRKLPGENLAITTYAYGYRPPMAFGDAYASISTDILRGYEMLARTKIRLIMPGGKGTFLERGMDDLLKAYNKCCPDTLTIFFDSKFWTKNSSPAALAENPHFADSPEEVVAHVLHRISLSPQAAEKKESATECANKERESRYYSI